MKMIRLEFKTFLLLVFVSVFFSSCSSDDDSPKNQAPDAFDLTGIADGASSISLNPTLSWNSTTDPDGDAITYDLYLDTVNPPKTLLVESSSETNFTSTENLERGTTYYWHVVAKDGNGGKTQSETYTFTTLTSISSDFLIGKWFFDSTEGRDALNPCEKTSYIEFFDDGTSISILYDENQDGECVAIVGGEFTIELLSESSIKFTDIDDGDFFITEIISFSETELVLLDFAFVNMNATLIKQ
ncbi:MAG: lipocalin family protein [Gelidibacter sp.]